MILASKQIYFSGSVVVYDSVRPLPQPVLGTEAHARQGFSRLPDQVLFRTIAEFGHANVTVSVGPFADRETYERVIEVPFHASSGRVLLEAPEDSSFPALSLAPGPYRLVMAQQLLDDENEIMDFFFEPLPETLDKSRVLRADPGLDPPKQLLETVDIVRT
jgi:hypothetical protein